METIPFDSLLNKIRWKYANIIKDIEEINKLINSSYLTSEQETQLTIVLIERTDKLAKAMQLVPVVRPNVIR